MVQDYLLKFKHKILLCLLTLSTVPFSLTLPSAALDNKLINLAAIRYIGHSSFQFIASDGATLVIDPFNDRRWLGYSFPPSVQANGVLISHPHYDHDANYHFSDDTPVFRTAGHYKVGSIEITGISSEHSFADFIRKRGMLPHNIIWKVTFDGISIAHFGDTRTPSKAELQELGHVDIILSNLITPSELANIKNKLGARHIIPMHYRIGELISADSARGMAELEPWLINLDMEPKIIGQHTKLERSHLSIYNIPDTPLVILKPSPELKGWDHSFTSAMRDSNNAITLFENNIKNADKALAMLEQTRKIDPSNILHSQRMAKIYTATNRTLLAITVLEDGLQSAVKADWSRLYEAHALLAQLYEKDFPSKAAHHHHWILQHSPAYGVDAHERARLFMKNNHF